MKQRVSCSLVLSVGLLLLAAGQSAAREVVLPVVVKRTAGAQGSVWETRVQVLRASVDQDVVLRRLWVALPGGGFVDDPATAPTWVVEVQGGGTYDTHSALILTGEELLAGVDASQGAVALEVTGEALIHARVADAGPEPHPPPESWPGITAGAGQLVPPPDAPLLGPAVLPFGAQSVACSAGNPGSFRTNIGVMNPTSDPLVLEIRGVAYWSFDVEPPFVAEVQPQLRPIHVDLAPLEWTQLNDVVPELRFVVGNVYGQPPCRIAKLFAFNLIPADDSLPYYAYVSVVYSDRNDPEFIPAVPGQLPEGPEDWFPRE